MANKPSARPLVTNPMDFIRGASAPPDAVTVIGVKASEIQEGRVEPTPEASSTKVKPVTAEAPAANPPAASKHEKPAMPWDSANPKVKSYFQVRMPEPLGEKLKWIQQHSIGMPSVHELVLTTLEEMANRRIKEIIRAGRTEE